MGRKLKWNRTQFEAAVDDYFKVAAEEKRPFTLSGLAVHLGTHRQTLYEYEQNEVLAPVMLKARARIENNLEEGAIVGSYKEGFTGLVLRNFHGWKDKQEIESTVDQTVKAQVSLSLEEQIKQAQEFFKEVNAPDTK